MSTASRIRTFRVSVYIFLIAVTLLIPVVAGHYSSSASAMGNPGGGYTYGPPDDEPIGPPGDGNPYGIGDTDPQVPPPTVTLPVENPPQDDYSNTYYGSTPSTGALLVAYPAAGGLLIAGGYLLSRRGRRK